MHYRSCYVITRQRISGFDYYRQPRLALYTEKAKAGQKQVSALLNRVLKYGSDYASAAKIASRTESTDCIPSTVVYCGF